jgi:hypothetical protein
LHAYIYSELRRLAAAKISREAPREQAVADALDESRVRNGAAICFARATTGFIVPP